MTNIKDHCRRCGKRTGGDATSVHTCTPNPVIEALEKDAARYRFIRSEWFRDDDNWLMSHQCAFLDTPEDMDAEIDKAIGESK